MWQVELGMNKDDSVGVEFNIIVGGKASLSYSGKGSETYTKANGASTKTVVTDTTPLSAGVPIPSEEHGPSLSACVEFGLS